MTGHELGPGASDYIKHIRTKLGHDLLIVAAAGVFVFDDRDRVLLTRHHEGMWTHPGGMIEPGESPADAALRETFEETGLYVRLTRLVAVTSGPDFFSRFSNGDEIVIVGTYFEGRVVSGSLRPDGTETLEARWVGRDEALAMVTAPRRKRVLELAFEHDAPPSFEPVTWSPPEGDDHVNR
jgi:8-oxo-dGTP pyrophosphatase MutT (NUDIX family)